MAYINIMNVYAIKGIGNWMCWLLQMNTEVGY